MNLITVSRDESGGLAINIDGSITLSECLSVLKHLYSVLISLISIEIQKPN